MYRFFFASSISQFLRQYVVKIGGHSKVTLVKYFLPKIRYSSYDLNIHSTRKSTYRKKNLISI